MTVIIGLVTECGTYLGCDGQVTEGDLSRTVASPKIFLTSVSNGSLVIPIGLGLAGSPFILNDVTYNFDFPLYTGPACVVSTCDIDAYVLGSLVPQMCEQYREQNRNFGCIVAMAQHLYSVDYDFNAVRVTDLYDAEGSGKDIAIAAMSAMDLVLPGRLERKHVEAAIHIAGTRLATCNPEGTVIDIGMPTYNGVTIGVNHE